MKTEEIARIYDKTLRVIASCETEAHLACARKFVDAANDYLGLRTKSEFAQECRSEMYRKLWQRQMAIYPLPPEQPKLTLYQLAQLQKQQYCEARSTSGQSTAGNLFGGLF